MNAKQKIALRKMIEECGIGDILEELEGYAFRSLDLRDNGEEIHSLLAATVERYDAIKIKQHATDFRRD